MSTSIPMFALCIVAATAIAGTQENQDPGTAAPSQDNMARIVAARDRGPEHQRLLDILGSWEIERREWRVPGQPQPAIMTGIVHNTSILGGRYLRMATTWKIGDRLHESENFFGYDARQGRYTQLTLDSATTWHIEGSGKWIAPKNSIVFDAKDEDPMTKTTTELSTVLAMSKQSWQMTTTKAIHSESSDEPQRFKALEVVTKRRTAAVVGR